MRPLMSGEVFPGRPHKASSPEDPASSITPLAHSHHDHQPSTALTDERQMEAAADGKQDAEASQNLDESSYGIQSLDDQAVVESMGRSAREARVGAVAPSQEGQLQDERASATLHDTTAPESASLTSAYLSPATRLSVQSSPEPRIHPSESSLSGTGTPQHLAPSAIGSSIPSSPKSVSSTSFPQSNSDSAAEDSTSQVIASSGDEEDAEPSGRYIGHGPQLVMPSISMPSRRPFTAKGKSMGKLKVLVAGQPDAGKTSLIRSIIQVCEDIVHVDPGTSTTPSLAPISPRASRGLDRDHQQGHTVTVTECYASTRPYPIWWSDLDESKVLRRRKSHGDFVLERNLCFVDTPGIRSDASCPCSADGILRYIETQLHRAASFVSLSSGELMALLGGNGGPQVDVVFFVVSSALTSHDLITIKRLCSLTNVIPVIGKADLHSSDELAALKARLLHQTSAADINLFHFGQSAEVSQDIDSGPPYAVSAAPGSDAENMDASLLMSSEYVQPLVPSDLAVLVERVFDPDAMAWLRHSAAKKLVKWINGDSPSSSTSTMQNSGEIPSTSLLRLSPTGQSSNPTWMQPAGAATTYALARVVDHTQREDRAAQVRLAKWASQLQRSIENERERYAMLARRERLAWLQERVEECSLEDQTISDGTQQRMISGRASPEGGRRILSPHWSGQGTGLDPRDPLGLLEWNDELKRKGWLAMQVVGSFGLIGGLALWIARYWNGHNEYLPAWAWSWCGLVE